MRSYKRSTLKLIEINKKKVSLQFQWTELFDGLKRLKRDSSNAMRG